ncbi:translocon-associated protein subunit gamma [Pelomyxa schiedti]|nr:translocon-associated protein subunit gamma [Pelomyxa schiedti]
MTEPLGTEGDGTKPADDDTNVVAVAPGAGSVQWSPFEDRKSSASPTQQPTHPPPTAAIATAPDTASTTDDRPAETPSASTTTTTTATPSATTPTATTTSPALDASSSSAAAAATVPRLAPPPSSSSHTSTVHHRSAHTSIANPHYPQQQQHQAASHHKQHQPHLSTAVPPSSSASGAAAGAGVDWSVGGAAPGGGGTGTADPLQQSGGYDYSQLRLLRTRSHSPLFASDSSATGGSAAAAIDDKRQERGIINGTKIESDRGAPAPNNAGYGMDMAFNVTDRKERYKMAMKQYRLTVFRRKSLWSGIVMGVVGLILFVFGGCGTVLFPAWKQLLRTNVEIADKDVVGVVNMQLGVPWSTTALIEAHQTQLYKWSIPLNIDTSALQIAFCVNGPISVYAKEGEPPGEDSNHLTTSFGTESFNCSSSWTKLTHFQCDLDFLATLQWYFYILVSNKADLLASYNMTVSPYTGVEYCDNFQVAEARFDIFLWILMFCSIGALLLSLSVVFVTFWLSTNGSYRADCFHLANQASQQQEKNFRSKVWCFSSPRGHGLYKKTPGIKKTHQIEMRTAPAPVVIEKPNSTERVLYLLCGLLVSLAPVFLFHAIKDMHVVDYAGVYLVTSLGSAVVISFAYHNVAQIQKSRLLQARPEHKLQPQVVQVTTTEATIFSIMVSNLFYLSCVLLLSYVLFSRLPVPMNFVLSVCTAAVAATFTSVSIA